MIKIDWPKFFVHRVIFGVWVTRQKGSKYKIRWYWNWGFQHGQVLPWHRCWTWTDLPKSGPNSKESIQLKVNFKFAFKQLVKKYYDS